MDNETKHKYTQIMIEHGFPLNEIERYFTQSNFTEEYINSEPFQKLMKTRQYWADRKRNEVKPKPVTKPYVSKDNSIEAQVAVYVITDLEIAGKSQDWQIILRDNWLKYVLRNYKVE